MIAEVLAALWIAGQLPEIIEAPPPLVAGPAIEVQRFSAKDHRWAMAAGRNTVTGQAFLRTRGGSIRTCAGLPVELWPMSDYTADYVHETYGLIVGGYASPEKLQLRKTGLDPALREYVRQSVCDAQGSFSFKGLPDGRYFVVAQVTWEVPALRSSADQVQGGSLAKLVRVSGAEVQQVIVTDS